MCAALSPFLFNLLRLSPRSPVIPDFVPYFPFSCHSNCAFSAGPPRSPCKFPSVCSSSNYSFVAILFSLRISFQSFLVVFPLVLRLLGPVVLHSMLLCAIFSDSVPLCDHLWSFISLPCVAFLQVLAFSFDKIFGL